MNIRVKYFPEKSYNGFSDILRLHCVSLYLRPPVTPLAYSDASECSGRSSMFTLMG